MTCWVGLPAARGAAQGAVRAPGRRGPDRGRAPGAALAPLPTLRHHLPRVTLRRRGPVPALEAR